VVYGIFTKGWDMSAFICCFWWFLAGLVIGWLLNWLLSKWTRKDNSGNSSSGGNNYNGSANNSGHASGHASTAYSGSASSVGSSMGSVAGVASGAVGAAAAGANAIHLKSVGADKALALAAGFRIKGNDDLEVIEGIGPKIAGLFTEHGAGTFDKVMNMSVPSMLAILEKGGPRFKLANPGSWAEQAKLCYENRWNELQTMQDNLTAGVNKSDNSEA
jgi:predicted flap endonuclease-1-like 5' DNA nuclease